jgi:hypothetical protein
MECRKRRNSSGEQEADGRAGKTTLPMTTIVEIL